MTDRSISRASDHPSRPCRILLWVLAICAISLAAGPATAGPDSNLNKELRCLALTIYFEARGEPDEGKLAVGYVVMNRASHPGFPQGICQVVQQGGEKLRYRCQFTWWCDGRSDTPHDARAWEHSKVLARRIYWDHAHDPTGGALWYHSDSVNPAWGAALYPGPKIGRHIFYRSYEDMRRAEGSSTLARSYPPL